MSRKIRISPVAMRGAGVVAVAALLALAVGCSEGRSRNRTRSVTVAFTDRNAADPAATTAAWSLDGKPGLWATYGFGGHGGDGALIVTGTTVLDSSGSGAPAPGADGLVNWNFSGLTVETGGTLRLTGAFPIRLRVMGNCTIKGTLDASGRNGANAPAGTAATVGRIAGAAGGPGGGGGGTSNWDPLGAIGSLPMDLRGGPGYPAVQANCLERNRSDNRLITVVEANCGGGTGGNRGRPVSSVLRSGCSGNGGGHARDGRQTDFLCQNLAAFGREFGIQWAYSDGTQAVRYPSAGAGGGGGGNAAVTTGNPSPKDDIVAGSGGGGGGGLEIECAGAITVASGGAILANGGNGGVGFSTVAGGSTVQGGYGGGGAGGSIWLSATSVAVESGGYVVARGGAGNPAPSNPSLSGDGGHGYTIIRDLGAMPVLSGTISPAAPPSRYPFTPTANGTSQAVSTWYDGGSDQPDWGFDASDPKTGAVIGGRDLVFARAPGSGQTVFIDFQAAPDSTGAPHPDPATWYPSGNTTQDPYAAWESDLSKLAAAGKARWLRFRVRFDLGKLSKQNSLVNQIVIRTIRLSY